MEELLFYFKKVVFKNYNNFNGRARRKEFWMFFVVNVIVTTILSMIGGAISPSFGNTLTGIWSLAILVPNLALSVRRLHDIGKSGKLLLLLLIPLVGLIILLVLAAKEGDTGENEYGADPKSEA